MIALLLPHTGAHCAEHAPLLACLPPFFRRLLRGWRRKPAVPAAHPAAGTALLTDTPPDGLPVLRDRWVHEVRQEHNLLTDAEIAGLRPRKVLPREDGQIVIDERRHVSIRPVNGVFLGDLPRRTPAATLGRAPWPTGSFSVPADVELVPAYGQKCVADVLAAEQAERLIA